MSDERSIAAAITFFGFGIWSFFKGFMRLRRKRLIENIPTSTIRALAMGLVELVGKAKKTPTFKTPLTWTECVFYRYSVERYEKRGKHSSWVKIADGDSAYCPFWLDDGTGKIMVFPQLAELVLPVDYEFTARFGKSLSPNLVDFMEKRHLSYEGIFGCHTLRFREWYIKPDQTIYVLGSAQKSQDRLEERKEKLNARLSELKDNPVKMSRLDLNQDGSTSMEEWDMAVAKIEQELLEEELKLKPSGELADVVIAKGGQEKVFIISDHSQGELVKKLSWEAVLGVFGGAALTLAALCYLLFRIGLF